jgi:hypothetical protein
MRDHFGRWGDRTWPAAIPICEEIDLDHVGFQRAAQAAII